MMSLSLLNSCIVQSHDPYKWTLDLPPGSQCSIGWSRNEHVDNEGKSSGGRQNEDRWVEIFWIICAYLSFNRYMWKREVGREREREKERERERETLYRMWKF